MEQKKPTQFSKLMGRPRLEQIPILHCRGTHRTVGFTIGLQFNGMITEFIENWIYLNKIILPSYETTTGRAIYEHALNLCRRKFPGYVEELEGIAEGSGQPFYKLFLLHLESVIASPDLADDIWNAKTSTGCTSLLCNSDEVLLGHTEDTCPEFLNNIYIVAAEILNENGEILEKFTTLTYAGHLPGYTMGYNASGLVYSINTLYPKTTFQEGTPRTFLTRAVLGASNLEEVIQILRDEGTGSSDGFSINLTFLKQEGSPVLHNIEVAPPKLDPNDSFESELSVLTLTHGDFHAHCNKYLRLNIPELGGIDRNSSVQRHKAIGRYLRPTSVGSVKEILSDQTDKDYPIFRSGGKPDYIVTVAVGIFDIVRKTWSLYTNPPASSRPVVVLPIEFV